MGGIGNTVDLLRHVGPSPGPPPAPESCKKIDGFTCHAGEYCSSSGSGTMTDYSHVGYESLEACQMLCAKDAKCQCFIHTGEPVEGFEPCKTVDKHITGTYKTARGYNAYIRSAAVAVV